MFQGIQLCLDYFSVLTGTSTLFPCLVSIVEGLSCKTALKSFDLLPLALKRTEAEHFGKFITF